jgi:hypothetical protein
MATVLNFPIRQQPEYINAPAPEQLRAVIDELETAIQQLRHLYVSADNPNIE